MFPFDQTRHEAGDLTRDIASACDDLFVFPTGPKSDPVPVPQPSKVELDPDLPVTKIVDVVASAGKTWSFIRHAVELVGQGHKIVLAQLSTKLIDQTYTDIRDYAPDIRVTKINRTTDEKTVSAIMDHAKLSAAPDEGQVLIISHSALLMLPTFKNQSDWMLFVDEALPAHDCLRTDVIPQYLRDALRVKQHDATYDLVTSANNSRLYKVTKSEPTDPLHRFRDLAQTVLSKRHDVFVKASQYAAGGSHLSFFKELRPDALNGWRGVTVMSALMSHTMMYRLWSLRDMQWVENKGITKRLRYRSHTNGYLLRILYASTKDWSKRFRDLEIDGDTTPMVQMLTAAKRVFRGMEFGVHLNKDAEHVVSEMPGAVLIPSVAHGLNEFQGLHGFLCAAALNLTPDHAAWLESKGISREEIRTSVFYTSLYQSLLRISLRNPLDLTPVTIIVPDKGAADFIALVFPDAQMAKLDTDVELPMAGAVGGRQRLHANDAAKGASNAAQKRLSRRRAQDELLAELTRLDLPLDGAPLCGAKPLSNPLSAIAPQLSAPVSVGGLNEENPCLGTPPTQQICACAGFDIGFDVFRTKTALRPVDLLPYTNADQFIAELRGFADLCPDEKESNWLVSPSRFDHARDPETSKGRNNVVFASGIWLDNDGGDLTHEEFARLFPHWRMLAYSTYSSTKALPRYRLFIPTDRPMSVRVYMDITAQIMRVLEREGFRDKEFIRKKAQTKWKNHGLDQSKLTPENMMYLPCMPEDPEGFIWHDYRDDREPLPVMQMVVNSIIHDDPDDTLIMARVPAFTLPAINRNASVAMRILQAALIAEHSKSAMAARQRYIDTAIDKWRTSNTGHSNAEYYKLAGALVRADVKVNEFAAILHAEAAFCHSPSDRRRDISRIIKTLSPHF